ncbi:MAG: F0F1 ATP synthase subunit alpha, partial [Microcoleaceae cyanobacterium]
LLKQAQNSPLQLFEQVSLIYAGINGYLDDIPVEQITKFAGGFREYLKNSKAKYVEIVQSQKELNGDAEGLLKEAIAEYKQSFLVSA